MLLRGRVLALVSTLLAVGCGSPQTQIDTKTALQSLQEAGFSDLQVVSNRAAFAQLVRLKPQAAGQKPLGVDTIATRGEIFPWTALAATRFPSVGMAKRRIENDKPLFDGSLSPDERSLLPKNFNLHRLREARVCNVVVSLYNPSADPALTARFNRALELLRKHC